MVVHPGGVRHRLQHSRERCFHFLRIHSHAQFDLFRPRRFSLGFHRSVQQHLIAAAESFFRHFRGERQMRQHGNGEREGKREQRVGGGAVVSEIVDDDGEPRSAAALQRNRRRASGERSDHVDRVRAHTVEREVEAHDSGGSCLGQGKFVAARDRAERLRQSARFRSVRQRNVDVVGR